MSKLADFTDLSNISDQKDFMRFTSSAVSAIQQLVSGALEFDVNLLSKTVEVTFESANVDQQIMHNLNKKNPGFIVINKDKACDI